MELIYLRSPTGQQHQRALKVLARLREEVAGLKVREVDPREDPEFAKTHHIEHAPGLIIDGRIEYVGIPRIRMLVTRIRQLQAAKAKAGGKEEAPAEGEAAESA